MVQDQRKDVVRDRRLGNLATPKSVQKLQSALHAKAKTEAGYRFYALYDKIYREDILAHAYAQCRSNKGAPGVDGQDFAAVEAYGLERWLGELALALKGGDVPTGSDQTRIRLPRTNDRSWAACCLIGIPVPDIWHETPRGVGKGRLLTHYDS